MLSIRMTRMGSKKKPFFRLVVSEGRSAVQGSVVENVGRAAPASILIAPLPTRKRGEYVDAICYMAPAAHRCTPTT